MIPDSPPDYWQPWLPPNKQAIIQRLLEEYLDQAMQKIQERSSSNENSDEERFDTALNVSFAEQYSKETCQVIYELWAFSTRNREAAAALKSFYESYFNIVAGFLRQINPYLGEDTVRKRAALIVAMLEGLSLYHLWEDSTLPPMAELESEFKQIVKSVILSADLGTNLSSGSEGIYATIFPTRVL